ncbi:MAG: metal-dependent transcriptional regulator [Thermoleophilaceae bacterium]|jgi:DtxR family Mn-dependent transcriptional regulator|nr:metal-dependent transcriptional regulator [Thermoleophilaceae bacterium]
MAAAAAHHGQRRDERSQTDTVEDYAKAIYSLEQRGDGPVTTSSLAERLGVTRGSASSMVKRLAEHGLAEHAPYGGTKLTERGRRVALEVLRHHRLLERYLSEELGVPWDRVHEEAEVLEHVLSEELEERIAAKLGHPAHDPHGDPIPTREGEVEEGETRSLAELEPGERATVARVSDSDPAMLRYLAERDLCPGVEIWVDEKQPFGGPLFVRVGDRQHVLGSTLAQAVRVRTEP